MVFTDLNPCCPPKHLDATNDSQSEHLKLCPLQIIVMLPCVEKVLSYMRYFAECKSEGQSDIEALLEEFLGQLNKIEETRPWVLTAFIHSFIRS